MEATVFCHTEPVRMAHVRAYALYDRVALSPVARVLGLYQNRQPEEVHSLHAVALTDPEMTAYSLHLTDVPRGPIVGFLLVGEDAQYRVDVRDRELKNGTLYVHVAP